MTGERRLSPARRLAGAVQVTLVLLLAGGCEDGGERIVGVGGGSSGTPPPAGIEAIRGDEQNGRTLEVLPLPLVVGVTDDRGEPLSDVVVRWEVIRGIGTLSAVEDTTDRLGEAAVLITLGPILGPVTVQATAGGSAGPTAEFAARATVVRVDILIGGFAGPFGGDSLQVVAGDTIEWLNRDVVRHAVASTMVPEGGASFLSGDLGNSERYRFVPRVAGLWEYVDPLSPDSTPPAGRIHAVWKTTVGDLQVVTRSTGTTLDPLFSVTVDGQLASSIGPNDSVTFRSLTALDHVVRLLDVAPNCRVEDANPRVVPARADSVVTTRFDVVCE